MGLVRHLFPLGDDRPHFQSTRCPCRPTLREGDDYDIALHRFFNGTSVVLQAEVVMGMRCEDCGLYLDREGKHSEPPPLFYEYEA